MESREALEQWLHRPAGLQYPSVREYTPTEDDVPIFRESELIRSCPPELETDSSPPLQFIGYVLDHWRQVNVLRQSKDCRDTPGKEQPTKGRLATLAAQEMKRYIVRGSFHFLPAYPCAHSSNLQERCEKEGKPFPYQLGQLWIRRIDMPSVGSLQPRIYFLPHA